MSEDKKNIIEEAEITIEETVEDLKKKVQALPDYDIEPAKEEPAEKETSAAEETIIQKAEEAAAEAKENAEEAYNTVKEAVEEKPEEEKDAVEDDADEIDLVIPEFVQEAGEKAAEAAEKVKEGVEDILGSAVENHNKKQDDAMETVKQYAGIAAEKAKEAGAAAVKYTKIAVQKADEFYNSPQVQKTLAEARVKSAEVMKSGMAAAKNLWAKLTKK